MGKDGHRRGAGPYPLLDFHTWYFLVFSVFLLFLSLHFRCLPGKFFADALEGKLIGTPS